MLDSIKSIYFLKMIFLNLEEALKLDIVRYNKRLQKKIDLSLKNYKEFTNRYIEYSSKTSGIEYNNEDRVVYNGGFFNGKRNGNGREYNVKEVKIFEGEYLKGKKWNGKFFFKKETYELKNGKGYIKEYIYNDFNYIIKYVGEYLNGKRNGKGKEFAKHKKLIYEGEYLNGKRNGKGKEYDIFFNLIFDGEYYNGKKWNGKIYFRNEIYTIKNGKGFIKQFINFKNIIFEGGLQDGKKHGKCKVFNINNTLIFEGEYYDDKKKWLL